MIQALLCKCLIFFVQVFERCHSKFAHLVLCLIRLRLEFTTKSFVSCSQLQLASIFPTMPRDRRVQRKRAAVSGNSVLRDECNSLVHIGERMAWQPAFAEMPAMDHAVKGLMIQSKFISRFKHEVLPGVAIQGDLRSAHNRDKRIGKVWEVRKQPVVNTPQEGDTVYLIETAQREGQAPRRQQAASCTMSRIRFAAKYLGCTGPHSIEEAGAYFQQTQVDEEELKEYLLGTDGHYKPAFFWIFSVVEECAETYLLPCKTGCVKFRNFKWKEAIPQIIYLRQKEAAAKDMCQATHVTSLACQKLAAAGCLHTSSSHSCGPPNKKCRRRKPTQHHAA